MACRGKRERKLFVCAASLLNVFIKHSTSILRYMWQFYEVLKNRSVTHKEFRVKKFCRLHSEADKHIQQNYVYLEHFSALSCVYHLSTARVLWLLQPFFLLHFTFIRHIPPVQRNIPLSFLWPHAATSNYSSRKMICMLFPGIFMCSPAHN